MTNYELDHHQDEPPRDQGLPISDASLIAEQDRIAHSEKWDEGLQSLFAGNTVNPAVLLSDGVKSGLPLEVACSIAMSISAHKNYPDALNALASFRTKTTTASTGHPEQ